MLVIRNEQIKTLDNAMLETFIKKAQAHLRDTFQDEIKEKTDPDLRTLILLGIKRAGEYGISAEEETLLFIDLMVGIDLFFEDFQENEWIISILEKENLNQQEKMDLIYTQLQMMDED